MFSSGVQAQAGIRRRGRQCNERDEKAVAAARQRAGLRRLFVPMGVVKSMLMGPP